VDEQFARVDEEFAKVHEEFTDVHAEISNLRTEMRGGFARMDRRFEQQSEEMRAAIGSLMDHLMDKVAVVAETTVEAQIDRKIAAAEVRLERKFRRRQ
jgi:phage host-nuclease inhibitor protein Gam